MEIKGEDFLKNLEIEKEKLRLKEKEKILNNSKQTTIYPNSKDNPYDEYINEQNNDELQDIVLEEKKSNKQKYIVLTFALILLFLITIIIIRLLSDPVNKDSFSNDDTLIDDKKIQTITNNQEESNIFENQNNRYNIEKNLDIDKLEQTEDKIEPLIKNEQNYDIKKDKDDLFDIKKTVHKSEYEIPTTSQIIQKQTPIKSEVKEIKVVKSDNIVKKEIINKVKEKKIITNKKGFYVQVGAFTKKPNNKLINLIKNSKYSYILHKMTINGILYTKVLVGPYKSRAIVTKNLNNIRKKFNNKTAYIMELK